MNKRLMRLSILIFFFFLAIFSMYLWQKEARQKLTVAFLDIGQGDAIYIEAPNGNQVLIDGGPGKAVLRELGQVMPFYDRSLDVVVATHPDADHIAGLVDVFDSYDVGLFMEPGVETDTALYKTLEEKVSLEPGMQKIEARRGMIVDLGGGAKMHILFPVVDMGEAETNTASIVARLVYGESEFILTGDAPANIEHYLITREDALHGLESDVLKAGHHGSKTSTSLEFVKAVQPEYAVISSGRNNRYGHPAPIVLETLEQEKVKILRTDQSGRIVFESDGEELILKK